MNKDISVKIQEGMSEAKNYNRLLFSNIEEHVGNRILEIGCSIGNMTDFIIDKELVYGIDIVDEAITIIRKKYNRRRNFKAAKYDVHDLDISQFRLFKFDTIVCINVLEHVRDDISVLRKLHAILQKGGKLLIIVPAHECLYGSVDKTDGHFRRYTRKGLEKKLSPSGFKIKKMHYFNFLGMFGWFLNGKILRKEVVDTKMLSFYDAILPYTMKIERTLKFLPGLSIICVAEKNE